MLAKAAGAVLGGVDAIPVTVEVVVTSGLPNFTVVGLPDTSVQEARERVRAAVLHLDPAKGFPQGRITVNLAPSDVRKQGPGLDLAVALGLLAADGRVGQRGLDRRLFLGELGLGGSLRPVRGALASAEAASGAGFDEVVCPLENAAEAALAGGRVIGVKDLAEAVALVKGAAFQPVAADAEKLLSEPCPSGLDLAQIRDQQRAKRAVEIAAAGGHNLLLSGPPGSGKTLLARALPGVLPRLTLTEALEATRIHSAAGVLPPGEALVRRRPFRSPHHGVSVAGMVGGGSAWTRPGEVSLAHRGVLFLDEFPEFPRSCLEALRQPLEDGFVTVTRARSTVVYPARFMLVAAMNPCACGHAGTEQPCRCTPRALEIYRRRLSGPLLDRIDLHVEVGRVETTQLLSEASGDSSQDVRARVERARRTAAARRMPTAVHANSEIPLSHVLAFAGPDERTGAALSKAARRHHLSARAVHRLLRVARTIADLEDAPHVGAAHVMEALTYRAPGGTAS